MIIPDFNRYGITEDGVVTDLKTGKVISGYQLRVGKYCYRTVNLINDFGYRTNVSVLRLLARTFIKDYDSSLIVRPKDGDYTNAVLSNVELVSRSRVHRDALAKGADKGGRPYVPVDDAATMIYETLEILDKPTHITDLSMDLQVPYSTARRAMDSLRKEGKVIKTDAGFVVAK